MTYPYESRLNTAIRVKEPLITQVYFAWCYRENNKNDCEIWEEGEGYLQPEGFSIGVYPSSLELVEDARRDKHEYDYEKNYYKDHYLMLVVKYRREDEEHKLFLTPEHALSLLAYSLDDPWVRVINEVKERDDGSSKRFGDKIHAIENSIEILQPYYTKMDLCPKKFTDNEED